MPCQSFTHSAMEKPLPTTTTLSMSFSLPFLLPSGPQSQSLPPLLYDRHPGDSECSHNGMGRQTALSIPKQSTWEKSWGGSLTEPDQQPMHNEKRRPGLGPGLQGFSGEQAPSPTHSPESVEAHMKWASLQGMPHERGASFSLKDLEAILVSSGYRCHLLTA